MPSLKINKKSLFSSLVVYTLPYTPLHPCRAHPSVRALTVPSAHVYFVWCTTVAIRFFAAHTRTNQILIHTRTNRKLACTTMSNYSPYIQQNMSGVGTTYSRKLFEEALKAYKPPQSKDTLSSNAGKTPTNKSKQKMRNVHFKFQLPVYQGPVSASLTTLKKLKKRIRRLTFRQIVVEETYSTIINKFFTPRVEEKTFLKEIARENDYNNIIPKMKPTLRQNFDDMKTARGFGPCAQHACMTALHHHRNICNTPSTCSTCTQLHTHSMSDDEEDSDASVATICLE